MQDSAKTFANLLASVYGPYAFGVTSLLIIWFAIVAPELSSRKVDHAANVELIQQLNKIYASQNEVMRAMERTAESLSTTATILERITDAIDAH